MERARRFQKSIDYLFKDISLLKEAFTHRSYSAENDLDYDNQRLEFLGDAVLEIILTEYLYKRYPKDAEGDLTRMRAALAQQEALVVYAKAINLGEFIRMGKGEQEAHGNMRDSTLADAFEALLGALFLDAGFERVKEFVLPLVQKLFPDPEKALQDMNPKGALQEYTQKQYGKAPVYKVLDVTGPDHMPSYKVSVTLDGDIMALGYANSRKNAEFDAARNALKDLKEENYD
jgi:ribonuclease-3